MKIETARLTLRPWIEEDRKPFAEMSADPAVMMSIDMETGTRSAVYCRRSRISSSKLVWCEVSWTADLRPAVTKPT